MTPLAYAAVVLCMALSGVNLLLTYGIIRKLRRVQSAPAALHPALTAGSPAPTVTWDSVDGMDSGRPLLVAFMASDCEGCHLQTEDFSRFVAGRPDLSDIIVVTSKMHPHSESGESVLKLPDDPRLRRVDEELDGEWQTAYKVTDFPSFFIISERRVAAAGHHVDRLPVSPS